MKKIFVAILIALTALSCSQRDSRIVRRIAKQIDAHNQILDLSSIAPFEWDTVFFFQPYTARSRIEQSIGSPWAEYDKSGIGCSDTFTLILFMNKGKVAAWCRNPRNNGECTTLYGTNGYSKTDTFVIEYSGQAKWPNIKKK